jgi:hypothetical protein
MKSLFALMAWCLLFVVCWPLVLAARMLGGGRAPFGR